MLTQNQKKALDYHRHLCVTANAGAGKTTVLVHRFVDILLHTDARVDQLVAITFTDKAASELKKKIAEQIDKKLRSEENSQQLIRLEQIRDQLASANIGTIHSFCAKLLREYPVEADVDAGFTVLEGIDQQALEQEVIRKTFEIMLGTEADSQERESILNAVRMLGQKTIQNYLSTFLRKREQIDRLLEHDKAFSNDDSPDEVLSRWKSIALEFVVHRLSDNRWLESLKRICLLAKGKTAGEVGKLIGEWNAELPPEKKNLLYGQISELVLTEKGTLRKQFIGQAVDPEGFVHDESVLSEVQSSIGNIAKSVEDVQAIEADRVLLQITQTLLKVYKKLVESLDRKKFENGQLDFEDLQLKTSYLLRQEGVRKKIVDKYRFIMVDEFQDTNRLQYEIIRFLVSDFNAGNLFIVGDPKQSIYGFRNAEVETFESAKSDIISSSHQDLPYVCEEVELSSEYLERKGSIILPESFRPLQNVAAFVNRVFSSAMADHGTDIQYDELVKGRANDATGKVDLLLVPDGSAEEDSDDRTSSNLKDSVRKECVMIARRIVDLMQSGYPVYDKKTEQPHPFHYYDAAILLRSRTHLREVEKALVDHNIPYLLSGGIGFYQTQEVFDFLNYFKFLLNSEDDVSLVGVLRSPFFAISDAELFEMSLTGNDVGFWEKCLRYVENEKASQLLNRAVKILRSDLEYSKRLPIPFLVQRIFQNTGWRGTVAGLSSGTQHTANIQKLVNLAREFSGRGFTTLYDFVERLKMLAEHEEREGQSAIEAAGNCVQVMTIHAAKGLEFPVVFVPFTHQKFRYDGSPHIDPNIGIGFEVKDANDFDKECTPRVYQYLRHLSKQKTEAEEKRIFYVACTRARDMLILSGQVYPQASHQSYLQWTLDSLGLDKLNLTTRKLQFAPSKLKILERDRDGYVQKEIRHSLEVDIIALGDGEKIQRLTSEAVVTDGPEKSVVLDPIRGQVRGEFFSATQMKVFLECPTKYFLKYQLGITEHNSLHTDYDENEDPTDKIMGELEGSLTHAALQHLQLGDTDDVVGQRVGQLLRSAILSDDKVRGSALESITKNIMNFKNSQFGGEVLSSKEARSEYTLSRVFGADYLTGTIDRLYKNISNQWCIVDYKTDRLNKKDISSRADQYLPQLQFYAILISKLFRQKSVRSSLVFLHHVDTPIHFDFSEGDISKFESVVENSVKKIKKMDFSRNEQLCLNCTYQMNGKCLLPMKW